MRKLFFYLNLIIFCLTIDESLFSQSTYDWQLYSYHSSPVYYYYSPGGKVSLLNKDCMFYSTDYGNSWKSKLFYADNILKYFFIDSLKGLRLDYNYICKTSDGGLNWYSCNSFPTQYSVRSIFFINLNTGWVTNGLSYSPDKIIITTNGGMNWTVQYNDSTSELNSIFMLNSNKGFVTENKGSIHSYLSTSNGGVNWIRNLLPTNQKVKQISFVNANVGYILSDPGTFFKTTNGGDNWTPLPCYMSGNCNLFYFSDENTGWS